MAHPGSHSHKSRRRSQTFFYRDKKITKKQRMIDMLSRLKCITISDIAAELGWRRRTVRGVMRDVLRKKLGLNIVLISERIYGIR